jgi:hypothetical protein
MSEQNNNQTRQNQDTPEQAPSAPKQQPQSVQAQPERPVFPSNSLLTEASQRIETPVPTKIDTTKDK